MSTEIAALPASGDSQTWNDQERALVEAAGLVQVDRDGRKTFAERPTVEAFLQHCRRTQLDPIARQIYCLPRKSKGQTRWTIQISIDGARLVAERTKEYEGQTAPQFTADGVNWVEAWLADEPPKAARVGVYRRGFREPLYAIARWDSYVVMDSEWGFVNGKRQPIGEKVSSMWAKMPDLMLSKVAEMLALRKAFPHDLSGLYSSEEMQQAGNAAPAVAAAPPAPSGPAQLPAEVWERYREKAAAAGVREDVRVLFREARQDEWIGHGIPDGEGTLGDYLMRVAGEKPDERADDGGAEEAAAPAPAEEVVEATLVEEPAEAPAVAAEATLAWTADDEEVL